MKINEQFLDYNITDTDTGNGDGIVLWKKDNAKAYECHLGNYSNIEEAKRSAILFFMIARPEDFFSTNTL